MRDTSDRIDIWLVAAVVISAAAAPAPAQIVIHEIMQNPSAVADGSGEWFEVHNPTGAAVDIDGWTVEDNDIDSFVIMNGGPLVVPAGGYLVLGVNDDSGSNGGVTVDYEYSGMALANGADELVLRDLLFAEVDRVEWDDGLTFPDPNGASMALASPVLDNDVGANWCTSSTPFGAGDLGTPGAANDCAPVVAQVVIHEIMQNPAAVADGDGEWLELHNPTGAPIDIEGWTVADNGSDSFVIMNGGPLVIAPGGYLVLGNNADSSTNGGVTVDYEYSGMAIANGDDEIVLFDSLANEVDRVEYDGGPAFPDPNGASMALIDPALDNNVGANWCTSTTPFGDGDLGTPGAANDCVAGEAPAVVINEILQNPSAVADGSGEWFELFNASPDPVDVDGWTVSDNDFDSFVIMNGGPLVIAPGGFLVLANNADSGSNGGVAVDYEYSGFFLANGGDEVVLADTFLNEVDRVEYDGGPAFPDPNGASMALANPALDNNVGANWCTSSTPFGDGDFGTPGAANDCPPPPILLNEVDADTPGSDALEFVELFDGGAGSTPLDGLVVVFFNGSDDASYDAFDLTGFSTDADGYFVLGNAGVSPDIVFSGNGLQNGADAVALYVGSAAAFPNDTPVTTDNLVDAVVYDTGDADDPGLLVLLNAGQPQLDENANGDQANHSNQRCPNGFGGGRNTDLFAQDFATPRAANTCPPLEIFTLQGNGLASPFVGFEVSTADNVVTCVAPDGFFIQTPPSRTDGDVATSDGIFVFTSDPPGVSVGDIVDVEGEISEFFGFTEFSFGASVMVTGSDPGQIPAPVVFDAFVPSPDPTTPSCGAFEFECYESMLVEVTDAFVTGGNQEFGPDPVAEVHISAAGTRAFREVGAEFPGLVPPIPVWDGNPEVFELDPDRLGLMNDKIPAGSTLSAEGVLGFEFNHYEIWPHTLTVDKAVIPVPVREAEATEITVGSLNMFRFFDDVDDPPSMNVVGAPRNDAVVSTAEYVLRRAKFASYILDVLRAPDILAVQEAEKIEVLEDLAADILALDAAVDYTAYLIEGNDVGEIDVGFLVRDNVQVSAVTQLGATELFDFDNPPSALHDRPPLLLEASCDGFPISVMVLHMRSLGGIEAGPRVPQKRFEQAVSVAEKVQDIQTLDPDVNLVVIGDFNAFEFTDGFVDLTGIIKGDFDPAESVVCQSNACVDLVDPDLVDEVLEIPAAERYSFIFRDSFNPVRSRGDSQVLDHALTSAAMDAVVRGFEYGRGNADAPEVLVTDDGTMAPIAVRSSDHDGLVLFVEKDTDKDGVADAADVCPGTEIPESVPTWELGVNRFALTDGDGVFDTTSPPGHGPQATFTTEDTAGCSCEQIIEELHLGRGHEKFGCGLGAMRNWVRLVSF